MTHFLVKQIKNELIWHEMLLRNNGWQRRQLGRGRHRILAPWKHFLQVDNSTPQCSGLSCFFMAQSVPDWASKVCNFLKTNTSRFFCSSHLIWLQTGHNRGKKRRKTDRKDSTYRFIPSKLRFKRKYKSLSFKWENQLNPGVTELMKYRWIKSCSESEATF